MEAKYVNDSYLNTNKMTYLDKLHETFLLLEEELCHFFGTSLYAFTSTVKLPKIYIFLFYSKAQNCRTYK